MFRIHPAESAHECSRRVRKVGTEQHVIGRSERKQTRYCRWAPGQCDVEIKLLEQRKAIGEVSAWRYERSDPIRRIRNETACMRQNDFQIRASIECARCAEPDCGACRIEQKVSDKCRKVSCRSGRQLRRMDEDDGVSAIQFIEYGIEFG